MKVALIGAKGSVGRILVGILEENWPKIDLTCFGTRPGDDVGFKSKILKTKTLDFFEPTHYDLIFSLAGPEVALKIKEVIEESGVFWIDQSSALSTISEIPLIIPEINIDEIAGRKIIASPASITVPIAVLLKALQKWNLTNVNLATYQSISGAGAKAMDMFFREVKGSFQGAQNGLLYEEPMAFNIIPYIGLIDEQDFCDEENKLVQEVRKILKINIENEVQISATCARVPVVIGNSVAVNFTIKTKVEKETIIKAMNSIGIYYSYNPISTLSVAREDLIFACRLKRHSDFNWSVWITCDNLRKGSALNSFQIAQAIITPE